MQVIKHHSAAVLADKIEEGVSLAGWRLRKVNDAECGSHDGWLIESAESRPTPSGLLGDRDLFLVVWVGHTMVDMAFSADSDNYECLPILTLGYDA